MKCLFSALMVLGVAPVAFGQDGLAARMEQIEKNNNMILSTLTAQKAQLDNLQSSVDSLSAKVDALSRASGVKLQVSAPNWAGETVTTATRQQLDSNSTWSAMSSGAGSCSSGSCGSSGAGLFGRGGLFRRR